MYSYDFVVQNICTSLKFEHKKLKKKIIQFGKEGGGGNVKEITKNSLDSLEKSFSITNLLRNSGKNPFEGHRFLVQFLERFLGSARAIFDT